MAINEESWVTQQVFDEKGKPLQGMKWVSAKSFMGQLDPEKIGSPKPVDTSMTLKQYTGRKFRDAEEPCELPDTATEPTSKG